MKTIKMTSGMWESMDVLSGYFCPNCGARATILHTHCECPKNAKPPHERIHLNGLHYNCQKKPK